MVWRLCMVKVILTEVQTASFVPSLRLSSTLSLQLRHSLPSSNPGWSPWNKSYRLFQAALDPLDDPGWIPICPPWPGPSSKEGALHPIQTHFHLQPHGFFISNLRGFAFRGENTFSSPMSVQTKPGSGQSWNNGTKWGYPDPFHFGCWSASFTDSVHYFCCTFAWMCCIMFVCCSGVLCSVEEARCDHMGAAWSHPFGE